MNNLTKNFIILTCRNLNFRLENFKMHGNRVHIHYVEIRKKHDAMKRNKLMKMMNGNGFQKQISIFHQNIVGSKKQQEVVNSVELLLNKLIPDVLVISEADCEDVTACSEPRRHLIADDPRMIDVGSLAVRTFIEATRS